MSKFPGDPGYQGYRLLQVVFVIAPIIAGLDKFFYLLVNWAKYLSPTIAMHMTGGVEAFFIIVGIVEIIVGIGVIIFPKVFSYIVAVWLFLIVINLLMSGHYYDIALRDFGLMLSALALARLSQKYA